mmetsp:Transcript_31902/g.101567  ORF Transcript_31902/g.101567 Transcript_31902/m.101567 type:complete len:403 (-) Transcript_31902:3361-4569(-)
MLFDVQRRRENASTRSSTVLMSTARMRSTPANSSSAVGLCRPPPTRGISIFGRAVAILGRRTGVPKATLGRAVEVTDELKHASVTPNPPVMLLLRRAKSAFGLFHQCEKSVRFFRRRRTRPRVLTRKSSAWPQKPTRYSPSRPASARCRAIDDTRRPSHGDVRPSVVRKRICSMTLPSMISTRTIFSSGSSANTSSLPTPLPCRSVFCALLCSASPLNSQATPSSPWPGRVYTMTLEMSTPGASLRSRNHSSSLTFSMSEDVSDVASDWASSSDMPLKHDAESASSSEPRTLASSLDMTGTASPILMLRSLTAVSMRCSKSSTSRRFSISRRSSVLVRSTLMKALKLGELRAFLRTCIWRRPMRRWILTATHTRREHTTSACRISRSLSTRWRTNGALMLRR